MVGARRVCAASSALGPLLLVVAFLGVGAPRAAAPQEAEPAAGAEDGAATWEGRAAVLAYFHPSQFDFLTGILAADRGALHLEGRYGYEDRLTASLFAGWSLAFGGTLKVNVVPMLGGVFGRINGVVPALELTLALGPLQLYSESEVVIDVASVSSSYFYSWSELTAAPVNWLRAGIALQRTRIVETPLWVSPGLLLGFSVWIFDFTGYWFEPGADSQYGVVSSGVRF